MKQTEQILKSLSPIHFVKIRLYIFLGNEFFVFEELDHMFKV